MRPIPTPHRNLGGGFLWPCLPKNRAYILKVFFLQGFLAAFGFYSAASSDFPPTPLISAVGPWGLDFSGELGWTPSHV